MTETPDRTAAVAQAAKLMSDARIAMLTTMTAEGKNVSRPMGLQSTDFDGDLWFFAYEDSSKVQQIRGNPAVNVSFSNTKSSSWTSISGTATTVDDRAKMEVLWNPMVSVWFPDGLDTDGITLIKVDPDGIEYWDSPKSKVRQLIGMARAAITHDPDKFPGDNASSDL